MEEEIVVALGHMFRLNQKSCIEILTKWKPKHRSISVKVLNSLKPLINDHRPYLWKSYFSKIEELDQMQKENGEKPIDQLLEDYGDAVNSILYEN